MIQPILSIINTVVGSIHKADAGPMFTPPPDSEGPQNSKLITDYSITEKWFQGWKRSLDSITEACIHHTDGGSASSLLKWMLSDTNEFQDKYKKGVGLFPLCIDMNGDIYKLGPLSRWWYGSDSGQHDKKVVNIEICHKKGDFTKEQYESLYWILFKYLPHWCPNLGLIVGHDYNRKKYSGLPGKGCPSMWFMWKNLVDNGKSFGYDLTQIDNQCYEMRRTDNEKNNG